MATWGCAEKDSSDDASRLETFALAYTDAWSGGQPDSVAAFFSQDGSLQINDGERAEGREAISEIVEGFMTALPDMALHMDSVVAGDIARYHWTLVATNSGPGGTGNAIRISGFEEWTIGPDGLIAVSQGHMDLEEYQRQIEFGVDRE